LNDYTIQYAPHVQNDIARLPRKMQVRIGQAILSLADNPRPYGMAKLTGQEALYRIRVGDYRIIYTIRDRHCIIIIVTVAHRREVYRDF